MKNQPKVLTDWQKRVLKTTELKFYHSLKKSYPESSIYIVGGLVRDLLLGRPVKDLDFVVRGIPEKKLLIFLRRHGRVNLVGRRFGVIKFIPKGKKGIESIDVALPRLDMPGEGTGAYRDVRVLKRFNLSLEEDLSRRDFTVNAMAWSLDNQELIDPSNGLKDLKKKILRTVGDPSIRFKEDYSRLLRGLRFSVVLNFSFEPKTWRALKKLASHLNDTYKKDFVVPREVVSKELLKAFYANPLRALKLYDRSDALGVLMPELIAMKKCPQPKPYHSEGDVWKHTELALKALYSKSFRRRYAESPDAELIMAVLFHDIAKPVMLRTPKKDGVDRVRFDGHDTSGGKMAQAIAERLKFSSEPVGSALHVDPSNLEWLIKHHLLLLHGRVNDMKLTTIEKYFVTHPLAQKLKQLMLVDTLGSIPKSGRPYTAHLTQLERVLKRIQKSGSRGLPCPLLDGDNIMNILKIAGGPDIGFLKRRLREQQLLGKVKTKKQARDFVKQEYARTNI